MTNKNLSQQGNISTIVIALVIFILICSVGYIFWQNFMSTKTSTNSNIADTNQQSKDEYAGWSTYTSDRDGYSIKYPSDWLATAETSNDGPYIRNFDPTSRPAEDPANHLNYPKDYINLRVLKYDDDIMELTPAEWYKNLGHVKVSGQSPEFNYEPEQVSNITINNLPAKKTKMAFTETNEHIHLLKNDSLYIISLYPYGISDNTTVKKMLSSFTFL